MGLLRELADLTGLSMQVTEVLTDTYKGPWVHAPGAVFADLAAAVADGADCIDGIGQLCGDREHMFGPKASTTTMWRLVDERIDAAHLPKIRDARAAARAAAWAAGAAPQAGQPLHIDIDATLVIDHSDNKAQAAPTWKKSFGHHPLLAFLDRPEIAGGDALAGLLRKGNAGSNTAADLIIVLEQALASLPDRWRPNPDADSGPGVVERCDSAGATHRFAAACRDNGVGFAFGFPFDTRVWDAVDTLNLAQGWYPAIDSSGEICDGAWVPEAMPLVNPATWPAGTRLILRKERPHPGAQLRFTDIDGTRVTGVHHRHRPKCGARTAGRPGTTPPPARPRRGPHPRGQSRRPGQPALPRFPGQRRLAGDRPHRCRPGRLDPVAWAQLDVFTGTPQLARVEINAFRYRVLHVAARITCGARQLRLRIDATWRWASAIATNPKDPGPRNARRPRRHGQGEHTPNPKSL